MNKLRVPFLDLATVHCEMEDDLVRVFKTALRSAAFVGGPMVEAFERAFADFCSTRYAVGVGSGTDALRFALMAAGVKSGDLVVTVPNTFIATGEAITQSGARIDFVDVDAKTFNMDAAKLEEYLETKTRVCGETGRRIHIESGYPVTAVVPVHLYGQPADMDPILDVCSRYKLIVVEDACQAHGAEYFSKKEGRWLKAGSMGRAAAFSFYPGKNLGACGEAGAVTTDDKTIAKRVQMLRDHGQERKYYHQMEGYNGRLDSIQAGILLHKLERLREWNQQRREKAANYGELLSSGDHDLALPFEPSWSRAVYHLYVVRTQARERLMAHLSQAGIGTGIHYPIPLHLQKAYENLGFRRGDFPVAEEAASEVLSLPMYPQLTLDQQHQVAQNILAAEPAGAAR
ncbi:MAG: DegT/DnrJ/EryC1/StrS family aminotransferase [Terriglobia bacterium]